MAKALSLDLRVRVLAAVAAGSSHRAAAERFGAGAASLGRWRARARGEPRPGPPGGDRRSGRIETQRATILTLPEERPDTTVEALCMALGARGPVFGYGTPRRFPERQGVTREKMTAHAAEQDRPDVPRKRRAWRDSRPGLDFDRPVFVDGEPGPWPRRGRVSPANGAKTNMARAHGRAPRGQRLRMAVPHGHWKTTAFVAGLARRGTGAPFAVDGPIDRAFSKPEALPRKAAEGAVEAPGAAIGRILTDFPPRGCRNDFAAARYDA